ncbi:MAG: hypothetical protein ACRDMV_03020 [Streptosporangiales bacterium]
MNGLHLLVLLLGFMVYAGAGVAALLAMKRDRQAAMLMLIGCVLLLVGQAVSVGNGYFAASFGLELGLTTMFGIFTTLVRVGGWCLIVLALFLGARRWSAPGGPPQPMPAQAWQAAPNPYGPPPPPGRYPPSQGLQPPPRPPQYGPPPQPPYGQPRH